MSLSEAAEIEALALGLRRDRAWCGYLGGKAGGGWDDGDGGRVKGRQGRGMGIAASDVGRGCFVMGFRSAGLLSLSWPAQLGVIWEIACCDEGC